MMQVKNYSDMCKTHTPYININSLAPQWPFRLIINGSSDSGKTNMLTDLVLNHLYYDSIRVYAKDLTEPLYVMLREFFGRVNESDGVHIDAHFINTLDIPNIDEIDNTKQHLFIFDDFVLEKDQEAIHDLFIRGRKRNISTIYISQAYFKIPSVVRDNATYFALYACGNKKLIRSIADTHSTRVDFKQFMRIYKACMCEPYTFLLIDNKTVHMPMHLRCCWDKLLLNCAM